MDIELALGSGGRDYMQRVLRSYPGAAFNSSEIVSKSGEVFAVVPVGTSRERALRFEMGGLSTLDHARNWLFNDLASRSIGTIVIQDAILSRADLEMRRPAFETFFVEDERVYYYLSLINLSPDRLTTVVREVRSFQSTVFHLRVFNMSFEQRKHHQVPGDFLNQFLPDAISVYLSAYDQESWIVWRNSLPNL
jgi:hypothetical protein